MSVPPRFGTPRPRRPPSPVARLGLPVVALVWSLELAAAVGLTLLAICAWATTIALSPLLSARLGIDPAVVSAPLVTTLVDATALLIYCGIAQLIVL